MSGEYAHVSRFFYRRSFFDLGLGVARWIPRRVLLAVATAVGWIYAVSHPAKARVAVANVRAVVPGVRVHASRIYIHFARTLADYFVAGARGDHAIRRMTGRRVGYPYLKQVAESGRGAVLATLHLGFFELGGWVLGQLEMPTIALTRAEPDPELTRWRAEFRARWGMGTLEVGSDPFALLEALKALREGKMVAALMDRPNPQQRLATEVDGTTLWCSKAVLQLAAKARCPVVPLVVVCNERGIYEFEVMEPIEVAGDRLEEAAERVWRSLLPVIKRHPEQYFQFEGMTP